MKKFNADGGFRKDVKNELDEQNLGSYSGQSLEDTKKELDDTIILSEEEVDRLRAEMNSASEEKQIKM